MAKMETLLTFFYSGGGGGGGTDLSSPTTPLQLQTIVPHGELKDSPCDLVVEDENDLSSDDDIMNDEPIDIIANN